MKSLILQEKTRNGKKIPTFQISPKIPPKSRCNEPFHKNFIWLVRIQSFVPKNRIEFFAVKFESYKFFSSTYPLFQKEAWVFPQGVTFLSSTAQDDRKAVARGWEDGEGRTSRTNSGAQKGRNVSSMSRQPESPTCRLRSPTWRRAATDPTLHWLRSKLGRARIIKEKVTMLAKQCT